MKGLLTQLGMGVAFTPAADFTGLSPQACCIGLVEQAATLRVGEQGTVASAATAVGLEPTAARAGPPPVMFDRPYLMVVTAPATGEPLIMARVADPAGRQTPPQAEPDSLTTRFGQGQAFQVDKKAVSLAETSARNIGWSSIDGEYRLAGTSRPRASAIARTWCGPAPQQMPT